MIDREKEQFIFGTAGHIDHGKTSLVKALTGVDADTLPDEKRRGITIELGFVFLEDEQNDKQVMFIDVPGHEKLVRTMVLSLAAVSPTPSSDSNSSAWVILMASAAVTDSIKPLLTSVL